MTSAPLTTRCYIGLGANLGNPAHTIKQARNLIAERIGCVERCSILYNTLPMTLAEDDEPQPSYVNAVLCCLTELSPTELLEALQKIESDLGLDRSAKKRWGAREIDLDILSYGDSCILADGLTIPHPEMHKRDFVLVPLQEIAPEFVHPVLGHKIERLLKLFELSQFPRTL